MRPLAQRRVGVPRDLSYGCTGMSFIVVILHVSIPPGTDEVGVVSIPGEGILQFLAI